MKTDLTVGTYVFHKDKLLFIHHAKLNLWLPPGGHIEANEVPDDAALREVKEETNLDNLRLYGQEASVSLSGNIKRLTVIPFHTNVHSVGDHNHYCLFYMAESTSDNVLINKESKQFTWMTQKDVETNPLLAPDTRAIALKAFSLRNQGNL